MWHFHERKMCGSCWIFIAVIRSKFFKLFDKCLSDWLSIILFFRVFLCLQVAVIRRRAWSKAFTRIRIFSMIVIVIRLF